MMILTTIRYVCLGCGWRWTREVRSRVSLVMERPIGAVCPTCAEEEVPAGTSDSG